MSCVGCLQHLASSHVDKGLALKAREQALDATVRVMRVCASMLGDLVFCLYAGCLQHLASKFVDKGLALEAREQALNATASLMRVCASVLTAPSVPMLLQNLETVLGDPESAPGLVQGSVNVLLQMSMIGAPDLTCELSIHVLTAPYVPMLLQNLEILLGDPERLCARAAAEVHDYCALADLLATLRK